MSDTAPARASFIAFEGIDGSGKGTQIHRLKKRLEEEGIPVFRTAEPNDSPTGNLIHQIMIGRVHAKNDVIAALFVADRLDHIENETNGILKFLKQGIHVISDRYYFSSFAYQSLDIPMDRIIRANERCAALLKPDLTVYLDVDPSVTMDRIEKNRMTRELYEEKDRLIKTRERYFEAFAALRDTEKVAVIDGDREPDAVFRDIWETVRPLYGK